MIREKLIAPAVGVIVVMCVAALAGAAVANGANAPAAGVTGATGATGVALVSSTVTARNVLAGHRVAVIGVLQSTSGLGSVALQERIAHRWRVVAWTRDVAGTFAVAFRPRSLGLHAMRLRLLGDGAPVDVPISGVDVFHRVLASWYAPGGETACGQQLTAYMLGVANKTLPCGTLVTLRYRHRTLRVPVIDRGPYVAGRDYDLTWATKRALRAHDLTEVWANH